MRAHTTLKEHQVVINHFKNGKSLREIAKSLQRSHPTVQCIAERHKQENKLTSKVRKSAKNMFTAYCKRWIVRQIKNNPRLSSRKLIAQIEKHLLEEVNSEKFNEYGRKILEKCYIILKCTYC
jgi:transposase